MLMKSTFSTALVLACTSIISAAGVITVPMKVLVRPEYQNAISLTKRYIRKRSTYSTSPLTSVANDVMYSVSLGIGTPPQMFNLAIDTGSPITWVVNKTCSGPNCASIFNRFDCAASSSCQASPASGTLNATYVSGDGVVGEYVTDIFNLGNLNFPSLAGVADIYSASLPPTVDGIMGLWYMMRAYKNVPINAPFLNVLKSSNALTQPQIGIWLQSTNKADGTSPGGEITFGGVDASRFTGDISYIDCDVSAPWTIPVASVSVNGHSIGTVGALATIDTGTSAMLVPESVSDAINGAIPNSIKMTSSTDGIYWILPCTGTTPVLITFGNFTVTIPYSSIAMQDLRYRSETGVVYCASAVMFATGDVATISNWLLGDTLLKNVYSVFDFGVNAQTGGRVGFAQLAGSSAGSGSGTWNSTDGAGGNGTRTGSGSNSTVVANANINNNAALGRTSMPRALQAMAVVASILFAAL